MLLLFFFVGLAGAIYDRSSPECTAVEPKKFSSCIAPGSIGLREPCVYNSECASEPEDGRVFCCGFLKKCVNSTTSVGYPIGDCRSCYSDESIDPGKCSCSNGDFPNHWVQCADGSYNQYSDSVPDPSYTYARQVDASGGLAVDDEFAIRAQCQHNRYRGAAGLPLLKWNSELAKFAREWGDHLKASNACRMKHSTQSQRSNPGRFGFDVIGENLAWASSSAGFTDVDGVRSGSGSSESWFKEYKYYQYPLNHDGTPAGFGLCPMRNKDGKEQIGHFTQLMWEETTDLGCDFVLCGDERLTVCEYGPAGNYESRPALTPGENAMLSASDVVDGPIPTCTLPDPTKPGDSDGDGKCMGKGSGKEMTFPSPAGQSYCGQWFGGLWYGLYEIPDKPGYWRVDACDDADPDCVQYM